MPGDAIPIVANPVSGRGRGREMALRVADALAFRGNTASIHWTEDSPQTERVARELAGHAKMIVACGGDGTVHNVANALLESGTAMAVAPAGRGNDLARMLEVPADPDGIASMIVAGRRRSIDLGRATGGDGRTRAFCTVAACGFDAELARRLVHGGPVGGPWAYVYGTLMTLLSYEPRRARFEGDFGVFDGEFFLAATCKTSMYGGGIRIAPGASLDDGLLRICIIRPISRPVVIALFRRVRRGTHLDHPKVSLHKTARLTITAPSPLDLYADGEMLASTPVTIDVLPRALEVIVP